MAVVECIRCHQTREENPGPPYGGKIGEQLKGKVCGVCAKEWSEMSIKIINEYRLNLREPAAREFLAAQMKIFFNLQPAPKEGGIKITDSPSQSGDHAGHDHTGHDHTGHNH